MFYVEYWVIYLIKLIDMEMFNNDLKDDIIIMFLIKC